MFVMNAIGELFTYVYNKKKKEREKQELENRSQFDQSATDNSQSSHTLVDNKQPQSQGYDNETLMEFLRQQQDKLNSQVSNSQTLPTKITTEDVDFPNEKENRFQQSSNHLNVSSHSNTKFNTLPPPLPSSRNLDSAQSDYSSNLNSYSYGTYSQSNYDSTAAHFRSTSNYQSNVSLATTTQDGSCSEIQQIQNVIASARKANDKFAGWQMFEDSNNNDEEYAGSNSLMSDKDDDDDNDSMADNWANFESPPEPNYPPPPLYLSNENLNEDVSIATISQDTHTLTNQQPPSQSDIDPIPTTIAMTAAATTSKPNSLNNSQNTSSAFVVRLDTPPVSARRRRSTRLSESSVDKQTGDSLVKRNKFESNFSNNQTTTENKEFFDFDKANNRRSQSLSKEFNTSFNTSFDSSTNRDNVASRNESRNSTHFNQSFDNQFDNNFDKQFDKRFDSLKKNESSIVQLSNRVGLNSFDTDSSAQETSKNNEIKSHMLFSSANQPSQYSTFDSSINQFNQQQQQQQEQHQQNARNTQLNRMSILSSLSDKKSLDSNEFNSTDPNDKYAVFNDISSMKFSIFSSDDHKNGDGQVFIAPPNKELNEKRNQQTSSVSLNSSQNLHNEFEDSFLANSSLNQSRDSNANKSSIQQLNQSMQIQLDKKDSNQIDSTTSSVYSSFTDPELIEYHKKFLQERQEKLDQIDKIFEEEKDKLRTRQRELNAEHLKQQKHLLYQQKAYQQEFYQRQKHQRQTILHQLQLQRLPVAQFDQCKLQLQQKLKEDQKQLQQEFIKKQQELKKKQTDEQNQIIQHYKVLEEQYLEKQSELLNSDFEIELDLPDLPNIFDNDESMRNEQALSRKFELSLKNEFDKLTNEIIQTTSSSLNSSPKISERCSTACSIASSSSHNPFIPASEDSLKSFDKTLFEEFDKALNLIDNKIDWNKGSSNSSTSGSLNRKFDFDFNMFGTNESRDHSLDYSVNDHTNTKQPNNERISSASSLDTDRPISGNYQNSASNFIGGLNKSLNESFKVVNIGSETKKPTPNLNNSFRSQQQLNNSSLKSLDSLFSQSMLGNFTTNQQQQSHQQRSSFNQPSMLPQQQPRIDKPDPFNCSFVDTKLNEMNRIKELRQHTQQQLHVSLNQEQPVNQKLATNQPMIATHQQSQIPVKEDKKPTTSIKELEELLGLSTSSLNKSSDQQSSSRSQLSSSTANNTGLNTGLINLNSSLNSSFNKQNASANQSKAFATGGSTSTSNTLNSKMFDNLFDLKKNSSLVNFANSSFNQQQQPQPTTNNSNNLFANDNFKKNSLSFQDLRSDVRTEQFINSLQKNQTQSLLPTLQQKNSLDVFGTVVVGDLNNRSSAKQLFNHFGSEPQDRNIFNTKEDPFKDDFFQ